MKKRKRKMEFVGLDEEVRKNKIHPGVYVEERIPNLDLPSLPSLPSMSLPSIPTLPGLPKGLEEAIAREQERKLEFEKARAAARPTMYEEEKMI